MSYKKIIVLLLVLLSSGIFSFALPQERIEVALENENAYHLSQDFQDLSYTNLVTPLNLFTKRFTLPATPLPSFEKLGESSRHRDYFSKSYLIAPGLGLEDIIFPFHSFL